MNQGAKNTRKAYKFDQVLRPMPGRLVDGVPMEKLRALALVIWRGERCDTNPPEVVAGKGIKSNGGYTSFNRGNRIELARHHRCKLVLIHEMAHWLGHEAHGWQFMRTYTYLLCRYGGMKRRWLNAAWRKVNS